MAIDTAKLKAGLVVTGFAGVAHEADGYSTFTSSSDEMVGMRVEVFFQDGTTDAGLWTATGISRTDWTMTQGPGSSFSDPFVLTNNHRRRRMTRFVMHGANSSTIFDRSVNPSTLGTANGRDLQELTSLRFDQDITAAYFDEVNTVGQSAVGDIYAGLDVSLTRGIARRGGQFQFRADTDTVINTLRSSVPEPTTAIQFSLALAVLCFRRRRTQIL